MGDDGPDGYSSTPNFHICNARVRTIIGSRPDGWSRIGNFLLWCTRIRTTAVRRLDGHIWIAILALRRRTSGRDTTSSRRLLIFPFLELGKKSETDRALGGVWTCCWNIRTDVSWHRNFSIQYRVWTWWHVVRMDGTVDRWASGRDGSIVRTADRELEFFWLADSK
jgi:hypothetical protein